MDQPSNSRLNSHRGHLHLVFSRKAREEFVNMKKERDYHRQHHNRIAQEKNNLVSFVKRYEEEFHQIVYLS